MSERHDHAGLVGAVTTVRFERPDGSTTETVWHPTGQVVVRRREAGPARGGGVEIEFEANGLLTVTRFDEGGASETVLPTSSGSTSNPYGTRIEHEVYEGLAEIDNTYDDDGELRSVRLRGHWGSQELQLRPDGARSMTWRSPLQEGRAEWDAGGAVRSYRVDDNEGGGYRWEGAGGRGRETLVGPGGTPTVNQSAPAPMVALRS